MKPIHHCALLVLVVAVVIGAAQEFRSKLRAEDARGQEGEVLDSVDQSRLVELRERLLDRTRAKIELMTDEELQKALDATNAEIRVMQAEARLRDATSILEEVSQEYKGTPPANRARKMLEALTVREELKPI